MATRVRMVSDEEAAFLDWLVNAPTLVLECRVGRHVFPGITDERTDTKTRQGKVQLSAYCVREDADGATCGTYLIKYLGETGILEGARAKYDHDSEYKIPEGVADPDSHQLTRVQRGMIRKELVKRKERAKNRAKRQRGAGKSKAPRAARPTQVKFQSGVS